MPDSLSDEGIDFDFDTLGFSPEDQFEGENPMLSAPTMEVLFWSISNTITDLMKFSMTIREASREDAFARSSKLPPLDPTPDIEHVREKFPKIDAEAADVM